MTDRPHTKLTCPQHPKHRADDCALCAAAEDGRAAADRALSRAGLTERTALWVHVGGGIDTEPHDGQEGWSSDPAAVLAWALRYAGRARVVPIIDEAHRKWARSLSAGTLGEAVFAALNETKEDG